jgi:hypothetical protein
MLDSHDSDKVPIESKAARGTVFLLPRLFAILGACHDSFLRLG